MFNQLKQHTILKKIIKYRTDCHLQVYHIQSYLYIIKYDNNINIDNSVYIYLYEYNTVVLDT